MVQFVVAGLKDFVIPKNSFFLLRKSFRLIISTVVYKVYIYIPQTVYSIFSQSHFYLSKVSKVSDLMPSTLYCLFFKKVLLLTVVTIFF